MVPFWEGRERDFPWCAVIPVSPRASHAEAGEGGYVSNVMYQKVNLIRLFFVSGFLSN